MQDYLCFNAADIPTEILTACLHYCYYYSLFITVFYINNGMHVNFLHAR